MSVFGQIKNILSINPVFRKEEVNFSHKLLTFFWFFYNVRHELMYQPREPRDLQMIILSEPIEDCYT